jgi:thymidylate kinase
MRPLFFTEGNDGLGKTHFLKELMRKLSDMRIHNVIYISKPTGFITKNYKENLV